MTPKLKAKRYTTSELVHFRNYERIKNIDMGIRVGSSSIQMVAKSCWRQGEREARARVKEDSRRQKLQAKDRNSKTSLKKEDFRQGGDGYRMRDNRTEDQAASNILLCLFSSGISLSKVHARNCRNVRRYCCSHPGKAKLEKVP